jgi:hypothetical protein
MIWFSSIWKRWKIKDLKDINSFGSGNSWISNIDVEEKMLKNVKRTKTLKTLGLYQSENCQWTTNVWTNIQFTYNFTSPYKHI